MNDQRTALTEKTINENSQICDVQNYDTLCKSMPMYLHIKQELTGRNEQHGELFVAYPSASSFQPHLRAVFHRFGQTHFGNRSQ